MLWTRDMYLSHMTFDHSPGEMLCELFGPLVGLESEWRAQGASDGEIDLSAFGFGGVDYAYAPVNVFAVTNQTPRVLSDTPEERIALDEMGRKTRLVKKSATIAHPLDYPVSCPDDWAKIKPWYAFSENRINVESLKALGKRQREGTLVLAQMPGGFDEPRQLLGEAGLCAAYYDEPEMLRDMLETMADTCLKAFERASDYVTIDNLCVHEDMAGKSGPLVGEKQIDEFIAPYYRKVWDALRARGAKLFSQDSDGNMTPVIDAFLRAGVNVMYPLEPMAGMDMVKLRARYGKRLAFKGGIDKFALLRGADDTRREVLYKCAESMRGGGTIFGLDHRIPNGVPIETYRAYVRAARETLGLSPAVPRPHVRMAF